MKKAIIIILIILIIICSVVAGGYFFYQNKKRQDPFELEWVRTYYDFMKRNNEDEKRKQEILRYYREDEMIEFCKVEDIKIPVLLYHYKELGQIFTNVFYINDNNKVCQLETFNKYATIEYLYDIETKEYDYYIHEKNEVEEKYSKISENIKANKINEGSNIINEITMDNEVVIKPEEKETVTTLNGEVLEISKFDSKFIKTTVVEDNWKDINLNTYEDELKKEFALAVKSMKKELTEKEIEETSKKEESIQDQKEKMTRAVEEIEQKQREEEERKRVEEERKRAEEEAKKAEEEAKKKAEEEAKKKAEEEQQRQQEENGNYTLKYGTYKGIDYWTENDPLSKYEITIVLKEDGTYTQTNVITVAGITENYSGKFTLSNVQGLGTFITFSANDEAYQITGNNQFTSSKGAVIKYVEN